MPETLFHGTRSAFSGSGGILLPPCSHKGRTNHSASTQGDRDEWVYLTPDLDLAWAYALAAKGTGRPRVLVVKPLGEVEVDDSTVLGHEVESYRAEWAEVQTVIFDIEVVGTRVSN